MLLVTNYSTNINFKSQNRELFSELKRIENDKEALLFIKRQQDLITPVDKDGII